MRHIGARLAVLVALLIAAMAGPASAQMALLPPPHLQSLDLSLTGAWTVITGRITGFQRDSADEPTWTVTVAVSETLKGAPGSSLSVAAFAESRMTEWQQTSALLLIAIPPDPGKRPTAIDLSDQELAVMTADLRLLRTPEEVMQAARDVIHRGAGPGKPEAFGVAIHATDVAGTTLDTRKRASLPADFLFVDVPVNERLEQRARESLRSEALEIRMNGVQALGLFKSPMNIELLKPLLDDEGWQDQYSGFHGRYGKNDTLRHVQFNRVRREAYATLRRLGVRVDEPVSLRPPEEDDQVIAAAMDEAPITSRELRSLTGYSNLTHLYLSGQQLSAEQWAVIGQLRSLQALFLEGSNISDASLRSLSSLPSLAYLGLGNTQITDAGLLEVARLPSLKKIDLGQRVTAEGVAALAGRRPDIRARVDEFAFLAQLGPRRVEQSFAKGVNWVLSAASGNPKALGLRCYALVFPPATAGKVDDLLRRELPSRGWMSVRESYTRSGVPIISRSSDQHFVDEVRLNQRDWPPYRVAPGERLIVISWNVDPLN